MIGVVIFSRVFFRVFVLVIVWFGICVLMRFSCFSRMKISRFVVCCLDMLMFVIGWLVIGCRV